MNRAPPELPLDSPLYDAPIRVGDHLLTQLPKDLYIPPDALAVLLTQFEGPLDLLLYLIRRQNLNILDLPIADITQQYLDYLQLLNALRWELAADYLVMAAWLAEIKSRLLLPQPETVAVEPEEDPRAELIRRLQEYERIKQVALDLDALPRLEREVFLATAFTDTHRWRPPPHVALTDLTEAMTAVLTRLSVTEQHAIRREPITVRQRMVALLERLSGTTPVEFSQLLHPEEATLGVVVTFLAALELTREQLIELVQQAPLSPLYLRRKSVHAGDNSLDSPRSRENPDAVP